MRPDLESNKLMLIDNEFKGSLSKALARSDGGDFAFLLASLQQNILERLKFVSAEQDALPDTQTQELRSINHYPITPLSASPEHFQQQEAITSAMLDTDLATARLLLALHPAPLSMHNDPTHIDESVIANCDVFCQQRMASEQSNEVESDETMLFDIIEQLHPAEAAV